MSEYLSPLMFPVLMLFIFMGAMLEKTGIAERLFRAIPIWTAGLPFIVIQLVVLTSVLTFPSVALWLPDILGGPAWK